MKTREKEEQGKEYESKQYNSSQIKLDIRR